MRFSIMTLSIMTFGLMACCISTFIIMVLNIITFSIMTFVITTHTTMTFVIMTHTTMTFSKTTFSIIAALSILQCWVSHFAILPITVVLHVIFYAEWQLTNWHCAECRYADCRGAIWNCFQIVGFKFVIHDDQKQSLLIYTEASKISLFAAVTHGDVKPRKYLGCH